VIALQEQLEFEADAMNEVSASGLAGIIEERDTLLQVHCAALLTPTPTLALPLLPLRKQPGIPFLPFA